MYTCFLNVTLSSPRVENGTKAVLKGCFTTQVPHKLKLAGMKRAVFMLLKTICAIHKFWVLLGDKADVCMYILH